MVGKKVGEDEIDESVGANVGLTDGFQVGASEGAIDGMQVGTTDGMRVGMNDGLKVGDTVGELVELVANVQMTPHTVVPVVNNLPITMKVAVSLVV